MYELATSNLYLTLTYPYLNFLNSSCLNGQSTVNIQIGARFFILTLIVGVVMKHKSTLYVVNLTN